MATPSGPLVSPAASLTDLESENVNDDWAITVIAVPDIGNPHDAVRWFNGTSCWLLSLLPGLATRPRVFEFQYGIKNGQAFSWDELVQCGDTLLEHLLSRVTDLEFAKRPIVVISHGLGGVVAKRAVGALYKNFYEPSFDKLLKRVAGMVFLGVPHPTFDKQHEWQRMSSLLRASTTLGRKETDRHAQQGHAVARVSQLFDDANIEIPVLSICETKATKINSTFLSSKRETLVDRHFARIGARDENLIEASKNHIDICTLTPSDPISGHLRDFFLHVEGSFSRPSLEARTQRTASVAWTTTASDIPDVACMPSRTRSERPSTLEATAGMSSDMSSFEILPLKEPIGGMYQEVNLPQYFFNSHTRNPNFFARQDILDVLKKALGPPRASLQSASLKSFALCGAGGLGKTSIAVEYAYANKDVYEAIFILQASDTEKLAQSFAEMSVSLGLESEAGDQIVSKNVVLGWLSQPIRHLHEGTMVFEGQKKYLVPWLLVFDNADDLNVLRDFWPEAECGSILVTSRDPLAKTRTHVPIIEGLDLDPFSAAEAGVLLRKLTGYTSGTDIQASEMVADKLCGLPLALTQTAGTIVRRDLSFEEFLSLYEQETLRLDIHQANVLSNAKTLYTIWNFEDLSTGALCLLNIIAFFDPDQISEDVLAKMTDVDSADQPRQYPRSGLMFMEARSELAKSSLVRRHRERKELTIHRIIQDSVRVRMNVRTLQDYFTSVSCLMYVAWPFSEFEHSTARWRLCEPVIPHVANLHRMYLESDILRAVQGVRPQLARLFMDLGWYYVERGNLDETPPYFETCRRLCDLAPASTHLWRGDNEGCMAQVANLKGDYKAAILHAANSVEIFQVHDKHGWRLPQAHNELCEAYIAAFRYEEAVAQADLAIEGYFALPEDDYPDWAVMNRAFSLCHLGRLQEASETLEGYLSFREARFGYMDTESFKTGQCLYFLGKVRLAQNRLPESLDFHLKALIQYQSTIGPEHFRVPVLYHRVGEVYLQMNQLVEACAVFTRAIKTFNGRQQYSPQIARTLYYLAKTQYRLHQPEKSSCTMAQYNEVMRQLSAQHRRKLTQGDIRELIRNNWD